MAKESSSKNRKGKDRADYGKFLIKSLSGQLQPEFGSGFSSRQLERYRQFYKLFPITSTLSTQLSWSHYMHLLGVKSQNSRDFHIDIYSRKIMNWSVSNAIMWNGVSKSIRMPYKCMVNRGVLHWDKNIMVPNKYNPKLPTKHKSIEKVKKLKSGKNETGMI